MKNLNRTALVLLLFASITYSAYSAQDPSLLLEEGIYTEETLGQLADAIKIYQQVLAAPKAMRATSAMALLRIGMCYQKSGRNMEARAVFTKFEKTYPELKDVISRIPGASMKKPPLGRRHESSGSPADGGDGRGRPTQRDNRKPGFQH
jgi:tetratricopeptide (TPR) repeat protein